MSSTCGNCDCSDKNQCTKGNNNGIVIVETEKSYNETVVMDVAAAEHNGNCKCGPSCTCVDCTCGH
uniref:Metallothionein-like protein 1 n=1 Tax=Cajanus cajan TaxID=3821 RepID=A0A151RII5_CAJCA|nr:Metallothionein-like protein 1 [Cajanus cajan]